MKLELTEQEVQVIISGLGELPLKVSGPVFSKIQQQTQTQKPEPNDHGDREM